MKELTLETLLAVFEEIFGATLFWVLVALAALITVLFIWAIIRDRGVVAHHLVRAQIWFPLGAVAMVAFVIWITHSRLSDIGGPIDWLMILGLGVWGGVGAVMWAYVLRAMLGRNRKTAN